MKKRTRKPREGDIRGFAQYEEGEWAIYTYEDFFWGEWIGNEEIWHNGEMVMHATVLTGAIKPEDLPKRLHDRIELYFEQEKNGTRKPPIKTGTLKELIEDMAIKKQTMPKTVNKKIWPRFFEDVILYGKRFEIRKDEDNIQSGDILNLQEWDPKTQQYTGRQAACTVIYVFRSDDYAEDFGLQPGYCVIGFSRWK